VSLSLGVGACVAATDESDPGDEDALVDDGELEDELEDAIDTEAYGLPVDGSTCSYRSSGQRCTTSRGQTGTWYTSSVATCASPVCM
jgi:hypothetical protein